MSSPGAKTSSSASCSSNTACRRTKLNARSARSRIVTATIRPTISRNANQEEDHVEAIDHASRGCGHRLRGRVERGADLEGRVQRGEGSDRGGVQGGPGRVRQDVREREGRLRRASQGQGKGRQGRERGRAQ